MSSLSERFRSRRSTSMVVDGEVVFSVYRKRVQIGDTLRVERVSCSPDREQSINLSCNRALLRINGIAASAVALRSSRCPEAVEIVVEPFTSDIGPDASGPVDIVCWNSWFVDEIEHAWVGEAGMRLGGTEPIRLECSDGLGDADFDDLVVDIITEP